jgi:hypothetical protein
VGWRWVVGPPGAGKTQRAVAAARAAAAKGRRVVWVGLPAQRDQVLRRLVADGPLLGVEFLTFQQLALLHLGRAGHLRPQLVGTARLALVAEALAQRAGALPTPGEAQLFARAIAEAKRHGLSADDLGAHAAAMAAEGEQRAGAEVARWAEVAALYEALKGPAWDDDDVRAAAGAAAAAATVEERRRWVAADLLVVDGWRELPPADVAWLRSLAAATEVLARRSSSRRARRPTSSSGSRRAPWSSRRGASPTPSRRRAGCSARWRATSRPASIRATWPSSLRRGRRARWRRSRASSASSSRTRRRGRSSTSPSAGCWSTCSSCPSTRPRAGCWPSPPSSGSVDARWRRGWPAATPSRASPTRTASARRGRDWVAALTPPADTVAWARGLVALAGDLLRTAAR